MATTHLTPIRRSADRVCVARLLRSLYVPRQVRAAPPNRLGSVLPLLLFGDVL
jgi:hypothetical protein